MCIFFKSVFACCLPPLAVYMERGCKCDFYLNLFLTLLGYFPGCIHAYCLICKKSPETTTETSDNSSATNAIDEMGRQSQMVYQMQPLMVYPQQVSVPMPYQQMQPMMTVSMSCPQNPVPIPPPAYMPPQNISSGKGKGKAKLNKK